ncbi:putative NreB protein [Streptomyces sp. L-9-10]|uniref:MFS transporter n=1 Tax=Streptomyces sp. L-9-10 TaxID=1478131 RepID=UPI00101BE5A9|nr:MFS transporter [Streptomyces sp. L-9-10]RYJ23172.1 putative NreB protein [Streptomyces sp. L-9-10]
MLTVLRNRTYRHLFAAQVVALVGTGLATVALSLLAYDLAGADASAVLGTALAVKMVAYVGVAPVIGAFTDRIPRRALLVSTDLVRAGAALSLPFVSHVWQIYVLIFLLQCASAAFTPAFQATIPRLLPEERDYTRALSLSRLAYDLESLFSPALAAALLTVISYNWLFAGTALGFLASAALVVSVLLPRPAPVERGGGARAKVSSGARLFFATPRLRALLCLDLAVAAGGAMVTVNTVVLVRGGLDRTAGDVSLALGAFGGGSMAAALLLPRLLDRTGDRTVMLPAAFVLPGVLAAVSLGTAVAPGRWAWPALLAAWTLLGIASSVVLTPSGRLLRRSAAAADLPAAFAARFSLSHCCWLLTYPLAGSLAVGAGLPTAAGALAGVSLAAAVAAVTLWPRRDPGHLGHVHRALPAGHPHVRDAVATHAGWWHGHDYRIDALHTRWPTPARTSAEV